MSRRMVISALVIAALGLALWWVMQNSEWTELTVPGELSGEAVDNPFYAAEHLVEGLGARASDIHSLAGLPPESAVLVITSSNWTLSATRERIQTWVAKGGRLVIDSSAGTMSGLQAWTHMSLVYPFVHGADEVESETPDQLAARTRPCRTMHVTSMAEATSPGRPWRVCALDTDRRLIAPGAVVWGIGDEHGLQALRMTIGRGSVLYVDGIPFTYRSLISGDNAKLLVEGAPLRHADEVYFLSDGPSSPLLYLLWREGAAGIVLLLLGALAYSWYQAARFGPALPAPNLARRSLAEQIRGTGRYLHHSGDAQLLHAAALEALEAVGRRKFISWAQLDAEERLQLVASRGYVDAERLRAARSWRDTPRGEGFTDALLILETARRRLLTNYTR